MTSLEGSRSQECEWGSASRNIRPNSAHPERPLPPRQKITGVGQRAGEIRQLRVKWDTCQMAVARRRSLTRCFGGNGCAGAYEPRRLCFVDRISQSRNEQGKKGRGRGDEKVGGHTEGGWELVWGTGVISGMASDARRRRARYVATRIRTQPRVPSVDCCPLAPCIRPLL